MSDYVLEGEKWGGSVFGTAGGNISWAVDSSVSAALVAQISAAFADWAGYANITFTEVSLTAAAKIDLSSAYIDGADNVLGQTSYSYSGDILQSADVTFDSSEGWHTSGSQVVSNDGLNFFVVALHEIGHALGMDHYNSGLAVMNAYLNSAVTNLTQSDIDGIQAIYGAAANQVVPDFNVTAHATGHDLFGDGSADQLIVRTSSANGAGSLLTMFDLNPSGGLTQIGQVGADWSVAGSGDLNGDGRSDLIMQHDVGTDRQLYAFMMGAGTVAAINKIGDVGLDWQVDGSGDFNGDGYKDILLERLVNNTKELDILGVNNGAVSSVNVAGLLQPNYQVDGIGDMNKDGKDDILTHFDDAAGRHFVELNLANYTTQSVKTVATVGPEWQALGLGDFNHDGYADILLERDTASARDLGLLIHQGDTFVFKDLGPVIGQNVHIDGIGDFNGDGNADISAHYDDANGTRTTIFLEMHDAAVTAIHTTGSVGHDWMLA